MRAHNPASPSADFIIWLLLALAAVFLFVRLDNGMLWQDEAETAVLARHCLQYGFPRAADERSLMELYPSIYGPNQAWVYSPWGQFYFLAFFFALFGESTLMARLPFAALGWFSIWLAWRFARAAGASLAVQRLLVAGLAFSVPFLIAMRQCRYYALVTALCLALYYFWLKWVRKPDFRLSAFIGLLLGLVFHVNFGTFIPTAGALILLLLWRRPAGWLGHGLLAVAVAAAIILPWALVYYQPGAYVAGLNPHRAFKHLEYYIRVINKYLLPLAALGLSMAVVRGRSCHRPAGGSVLSPEAWQLVAVMVSCHVLFLLIPEQRHLRYLMPVVPFFALLQAAWLAGMIRFNRLAGMVLAVLVLATGLLHSGRLRTPLSDFGHELTHAYRGPMDGVVEYLQKHALPDQTVKIAYDDRTLMFYTQLAIEPPTRFREETFPDWVVIRREWTPAEFFDSPYFRRIEEHYERIVLDAPDVRWQGREDPGTHPFRTASGAPGVVIYRKRAGV